jgi:uncharacterized protein YdeI (YjbR/CyaY-like superfamily)
MVNRSSGSLKRPRQRMPAFVRRALDDSGLADAYRSRPPYQRNDYLWWINTAKREATKERRLTRMLDELKHGGLYMGMRWNSDA